MVLLLYLEDAKTEIRKQEAERLARIRPERLCVPLNPLLLVGFAVVFIYPIVASGIPRATASRQVRGMIPYR